jgi:ATP dependent DNA ligase domain
VRSPVDEEREQSPTCATSSSRFKRPLRRRATPCCGRLGSWRTRSAADSSPRMCARSSTSTVFGASRRASQRRRGLGRRARVAALRLPEPMLSRPGLLPSGSGWSFELKWDGFRALVSTEDDFRVHSRRGRNMTAVLPELRAPSRRPRARRRARCLEGERALLPAHLSARAQPRRIRADHVRPVRTGGTPRSVAVASVREDCGGDGREGDVWPTWRSNESREMRSEPSYGRTKKPSQRSVQGCDMGDALATRPPPVIPA